MVKIANTEHIWEGEAAGKWKNPFKYKCAVVLPQMDAHRTYGPITIAYSDDIGPSIFVDICQPD